MACFEFSQGEDEARTARRAMISCSNANPRKTPFLLSSTLFEGTCAVFGNEAQRALAFVNTRSTRSAQQTVAAPCLYVLSEAVTQMPLDFATLKRRHRDAMESLSRRHLRFMEERVINAGMNSCMWLHFIVQIKLLACVKRAPSNCHRGGH
jgi:hypothetical protein